MVGSMILSLAYILLERPYLPSRFSNDSDMIQLIARQELQLSGDKSYQRVGDIYRLMRLAEYPEYAGLLGFALFCLAVAPLFRITNASSFSFLTVILAIMSLTLATIFLGTFSKDFLVILISLLAIFGGRSARSDIALVTGMALYAHLFRSYWWLVIFIFLGIRIVNYKQFSPKITVLSIMGGLGILAVLFPRRLGVDINHYRDRINSVRVEEADAQTMIAPFFQLSGVVAGWANTLLTQVSFYIPIPLVAEMTAYHTLVAFYLLLMWSTFFRAVLRYSVLKLNEPNVSRMICLIIAFTTVQSIFEPDYGSYLRHLTPLLPVMLMTLIRQERLSGLHMGEDPGIPKVQNGGSIRWPVTPQSYSNE